MVARQWPPSTTSIETVSSGISASSPPYQSAKRSGSVHSLHTRSRGASKTRVIEKPGASAIGASAHARVEPVEAGLPEAPVAPEPVDGLLERRRLEARGTQLGRAPARDQARALEHG